MAVILFYGMMLIVGLEMSDSISLDFHKGLSASFGTSAVLVRDGNLLRSAMKRDVEPYLPLEGDGYSPIDLSLEYSRPFRAFPVWFMLKTVGTEAIKSQITEKIKLTEYAYNTLSQMKNVSMYMKPDLTIIAFRYNPTDNDFTRKWMELINKTGEMSVSSTTEDGLLFIRLCILSFRTHLETIKTALRIIKRTLTVLQTLCSKDMKCLNHLAQITETTRL